VWAALFVAAALAIVLSGYGYYRREAAAIREAKRAEIAAIGRLKAGQIEQWRRERLADAAFLARVLSLRGDAAGVERSPESPESRTDDLETLRAVVAAHGYADALVIDAQGRIRLSVRPDPDPVGPASVAAAAKAGSTAAPVLSDFFRCPHGFAHLDAAAALAGPGGPRTPVLILRSNAEDFLYPLIQAWPTPSASAETLLVQREGEEVLFLNALRHRLDAALSLRVPLSRTDVPAVQAALGREGPFEGRDYRGVAVIAELLPVADSPWSVVAKVDADEVLAEARYRAGVAALFAGGLLLLAGSGAALLHRRRQARHFQALYEAERRHRETHEIFRTTLYSIGDAVITTDVAGRVREMNRAAEALTGFKEAEARGAKLAEVFRIENEETGLPVENPAERVLRDGVVVGLANHTVLVARDGTRRPIDDSGAPIRDANGAVTGVVLVFHDQSEERAAQRALAESEARYRQVVESSTDAVLIRSGDRIVYANPAAVRMFRAGGAEELVGRGYLELVHPEDRAESAERIRKGLSENWIAPPREHRILALDGQVVPVESTGVPIQHRGETQIFGIFRDISERRRLEAQFRQAQKMEAVGRLAGGVAHDFNNMLGVILGFAELAIMKLPADHPVQPQLSEIKSAAMRSADIARQLLAFARRQTIAPRVLDLNDTIAAMLKMLRRLIGEDIHLLWKPGAGVWPVKMDPSQLDQILANLVVNARDAISGIGRITIETGNASLDPAYCAAHPGFSPGDYVMLAVSDDGCGMDAETLGKLFEPFFTTKDVGRGTGLGLATIYGIVKQNDGFINVYSEPGQGSTFKIFLPRHAAPVEAAAAPPEDAPVPPGTETVLLVEDEKSLLRFAAALLAELGYTVLAAASPGEALGRAEAHAGAIDLLVTDVVMPEMDGRKLWERLQARRPGLKCLFMSGYTSNSIAHRGVLEDGVHFVHKPFSREVFARKLREALAG
jgi:PAS domain S-box-containing protein